MYKVKLYQTAVNFGEPELFNTKKEAIKYARDFRNDRIKPCKKVNDTTIQGYPIFKAVHPAFGVEAYATVIKIN